MRRKRNLRYAVSFGLVVSLAGVLFAQGAPQKTLVVNGKTVGPVVVQSAGRSYVDIETLARATNGTVTIGPDRIVLTIPAGESAAGAGPTQQQDRALSKDFARTAIAELAEMREWRAVLTTVITYGLPVVGTWPQDYHDRIESDLMQTKLAASNAADQDAAQLLENEFANLSAWAGDVVASRKALNAARTVDPNALQNDAVLTKISNCSSFLSNMIISGFFSDTPSCH